MFPLTCAAVVVSNALCDESKQQCLDNCYATYLNQVSICKMAPTPKARAQCYAGASDLHGQCRAGCK